MLIELLSIVSGSKEGNFNNIIYNIHQKYNRLIMDQLEPWLSMKEIHNSVLFLRRVKNLIETII